MAKKFDRADLDRWLLKPVRGTYYRKHELATAFQAALAVVDEAMIYFSTDNNDLEPVIDALKRCEELGLTKP